MDIIVAGVGDVGAHLAKMLSNEKHDITVIDPDGKKLKLFDSVSDVLTVQGSVTSFKTLKDANVEKCDLFIAVSHFENTNLTGALLAKRLGAKKTIARIDSSEFLVPRNKEHFISMGIDYMIYPERIASKEIITLLNKTSSTDFVDFTGGRLSMYVIKLEENAPVINKKLKDIQYDEKKHEYRAVAITRNGDTIIPSGDDIFQSNDLVYVVTNQSSIKQIMRYAGKEEFPVRNILIMGGSRIGIRTALDLEADTNIKLIEINGEKCEKISDLVDKTLVINGDGRDIELLRDSGIKGMDAFIAVTGNSETNILSCLMAKKMGVKKVICEVENFDYIGIAENMGLDTIINKKVSAASRIFRFTMTDEVTSIKCLTGTEAEVFEFIAKPGSVATKGPIKDINFPKDAIIGGIIRGKSSFVARGETQIKENDRVVVFALPSAIFKVGKFFSS